MLLQLLIVAVIGAIANTVALLVLRGGSKDSINMRGAYLEVLGDLIGSGAVIVAGVVILLTGFALAHSIASLPLAAPLVTPALALLRDVRPCRPPAALGGQGAAGGPACAGPADRPRRVGALQPG